VTVGLVVLALSRGSDVVVRIGLRVAAVAVLGLLAALVLGWLRLVPASLVLVGSTYAVYLAVDDAPLDSAAPVFAAGLFLAAELAYWSLEERDRIRAEAGETLRRIAIVAALAIGALLLGGGLLALADSERTSGLAVDLLGATAAAAILLVLAVSAHRPTNKPRS
jgi:hypothetical protein